MKQAKAPVGIALIARDAEHTLGIALQSIRPYVEQLVVGVDTLTTDRTAKIARKYADDVFPVQVSDWHECQQHGRILAQDFAGARNESFKHLDQALPFLGWMDADDIIEGGEHLARICADLPPAAVGVWAPYFYSYILKDDGARHVNTLFDRERLLRTKVQGEPMGWKWEYRVHEVCKPSREGPWGRTDSLIWVHQHQQHKTETSAPRNLTLLEIEYEDKGDEPRTVFYLGNQYFAMQQWTEAAAWYERYTGLPQTNPYELWQSYVYMSIAYENLGNLDAALQAAFGAIEARPEHPEPYYRLSHIYTVTGEYDKTHFWKRLGDERVDAPNFAFKNPLDRSFNSWMPVAEAYFRSGRVSEAKAAWQEATKAFVDERVVERIKDCEATEQAMGVAQSYYDLSKTMDDDQKLTVYAGLPDSVRKFGRARNVAMPIRLKRRRASTQPRILFWCNRSQEPWAPPSLDTTGIGGSETAVVEVAKRFAAAGWQADVYCGADHMEGEYDGVGYWDPERLNADEACDVLVSWRQPGAHDLPVQAKQRVLWCHDLNYGPDVADDFLKWDTVLGVSAWHAFMLEGYYDVTGRLVSSGQLKLTEAEFMDGPLKVDYVPNGIDLARFAEPVKKVPFQCVYASSPDRGLLKLLDMWPAIVQAEPGARLQVAYGWLGLDKRIAAGDDQASHLKEAIEDRLTRLKDTVTWRGRLGQAELARLYAESYLWLYPTAFLEVSCISAMEAMAAGCVPVTTACGALVETIGDAGFLLPSPNTSRAYGPLFEKVATGALIDAQARQVYASVGRERAKELTWDKAVERWFSVLGVDARQEVAA